MTASDLAWDRLTEFAAIAARTRGKERTEAREAARAAFLAFDALRTAADLEFLTGERA